MLSYFFIFLLLAIRPRPRLYCLSSRRLETKTGLPSPLLGAMQVYVRRPVFVVEKSQLYYLFTREKVWGQTTLRDPHCKKWGSRAPLDPVVIGSAVYGAAYGPAVIIIG